MDVKWIKVTTDIFDDEKILLIESLPDADSIIVIWFKLLCLAGKINNSGVFMLNDRIAYTDKMLATIFRRKESTVALALNTFQQYGMIEIIDNVITIPNWGKHQNLDALEKRSDYMRDYMREYRKKQKELTCKTNVNHLHKSNVSRTEEDIDIDIEKDIEIETDIEESIERKPRAPRKKSFGQYKNVTLTDEEYDRLVADYGQERADRAVEYLDEYVEMKGTKYKSSYLAIKKWVFDALAERDQRRAAAGNKTAQQLDDFYDMAAKWAESEGNA